MCPYAAGLKTFELTWVSVGDGAETYGYAVDSLLPSDGRWALAVLSCHGVGAKGKAN